MFSWKKFRKMLKKQIALDTILTREQVLFYLVLYFIVNNINPIIKRNMDLFNLISQKTTQEKGRIDLYVSDNFGTILFVIFQEKKFITHIL